MKLSELKPGTKMLVPCARCAVKRSLIYRTPSEYKRQKEKICVVCATEDRCSDLGGAMHEKNPNHRRGEILDRWRMENQ